LGVKAGGTSDGLEMGWVVFMHGCSDPIEIQVDLSAADTMERLQTFELLTLQEEELFLR
jgi:hypothetical protein